MNSNASDNLSTEGGCYGKAERPEPGRIYRSFIPADNGRAAGVQTIHALYGVFYSPENAQENGSGPSSQDLEPKRSCSRISALRVDRPHYRGPCRGYRND